MQLAGTASEAWGGLRFYTMRRLDPVFRGKLNDEVKANERSKCEAVKQVGTDLALELFGGAKERRLMKKVRGFIR